MSVPAPANPGKTAENRSPHRGHPQKTWGGQGGQRADNSATATADKGGQAETRRGHRADKSGQRGLSGSGQADNAPIGACCPAALSAGRPPRPDPSAALADPLAEAGRLVRSLVPNWGRPEQFHEVKAEVLDLLRRAAAAPCARCEGAELRVRLARAHALLRAAGADLARHRRLLASAVRPPRRRPAAPDPRQGRLPLHRDSENDPAAPRGGP